MRTRLHFLALFCGAALLAAQTSKGPSKPKTPPPMKGKPSESPGRRAVVISQAGSRNPVWNWPAEIAISTDRKRLDIRLPEHIPAMQLREQESVTIEIGAVDSALLDKFDFRLNFHQQGRKVQSVPFTVEDDKLLAVLDRSDVPSAGTYTMSMSYRSNSEAGVLFRSGSIVPPSDPGQAIEGTSESTSWTIAREK